MSSNDLSGSVVPLVRGRGLRSLVGVAGVGNEHMLSVCLDDGAVWAVVVLREGRANGMISARFDLLFMAASLFIWFIFMSSIAQHKIKSIYYL